MKKIVSLILVFAILLSLAATCYATGEGVISVPQGIKPASEEEIAWWNATNEETLENAIAKRQQDASVESVESTTWIRIPNYQYYAQEEYNSCGAAAVRMLLKTLTGITYDESTIRKGCNHDDKGITIKDSVSYVNKNQSVHSYAAKYSLFHSWFTDNLYDAIGSSTVPAIVSIITQESDGWMYDTNGHALLIFGVLSDKSAYLIADPLGGFMNIPEWEEYIKTDDELFKAYGAANGYMV